MPIDVHEIDDLITQARRLLATLLDMRAAAAHSPELSKHRAAIEDQIADREARRRRRGMGAVAWLGGGIAGALAALWRHQAATLVAAGGLAGIVTVTAVVARHTIPRPQARPPVIVTTATQRPGPTVTTTVTPSATPRPTPTPAPTPAASPTGSLPQSAPPPTPGTPIGDDNTRPPRRGRRRPTPIPPGSPPTPSARPMMSSPAAPACALAVDLKLAPVAALVCLMAPGQIG